MNHSGWRNSSEEGRVSDRKLRLFCCACCSRYTRMFNDSSTEASASLLERYADGWVEESDRIHPNTFLHHNLVNEMWCPDPYLAALRAADGIAGDVGHRFNYGHQRDRAVQSEFAAQAVLFREIAGNPFSIA